MAIFFIAMAMFLTIAGALFVFLLSKKHAKDESRIVYDNTLGDAQKVLRRRKEILGK